MSKKHFDKTVYVLRSKKNVSITICEPPEIQEAHQVPEFQDVPREELSGCSRIPVELMWGNYAEVGEEEGWGECFRGSYLTI